MWRPKSLRVSDPECIALWNTLGFAIEMRIDWQTGELMAPIAIRYGCGTPSMMAPGQNARVLLALIDRILPEEVQVRVFSPSTSEGMIHGRGRAPSVASSMKDSRTRFSHGACPMGATPAVKSDTLRGLSVGVGTSSVCARLSRTRRAI